MEKIEDLLSKYTEIKDKRLKESFLKFQNICTSNGIKPSCDKIEKEENGNKIDKFPSYPDNVRIVPNGILRSALFGAIRKGRRRYINNEEIASVKDVSIRYKGERLDQGDLDVWEASLFLLRGKNLHEECRTTSYELLNIIGKKDTGENRKILYQRIMRLRANAINIIQGKYSYIGGLIDFAAKDEETQEWVISLNPKIRALFEADQFTQIDWDIRCNIEGQLAQWLHGFYSSHAEPYPIKIDTLRQLSGSETGETWKFTQQLKSALDSVKSACAAHGQIFEWSISKGIVSVTRSPSKSQRRHLAHRNR